MEACEWIVDPLSFNGLWSSLISVIIIYFLHMFIGMPQTHHYACGDVGGLWINTPCQTASLLS